MDSEGISAPVRWPLCATLDRMLPDSRHIELDSLGKRFATTAQALMSDEAASLP